MPKKKKGIKAGSQRSVAEVRRAEAATARREARRKVRAKAEAAKKARKKATTAVILPIKKKKIGPKGKIKGGRSKVTKRKGFTVVKRKK